MTELERQLMKALKEWGEQYEQGQKRQSEQVEALSGQVERLAKQVKALARQYGPEQEQQAERVKALSGQVEQLASDYRDLAELLRGL